MMKSNGCKRLSANVVQVLCLICGLFLVPCHVQGQERVVKLKRNAFMTTGGNNAGYFSGNVIRDDNRVDDKRFNANTFMVYPTKMVYTKDEVHTQLEYVRKDILKYVDARDLTLGEEVRNSIYDYIDNALSGVEPNKKEGKSGDTLDALKDKISALEASIEEMNRDHSTIREKVKQEVMEDSEFLERLRKLLKE